jgi:hypothetical protein
MTRTLFGTTLSVLLLSSATPIHAQEMHPAARSTPAFDQLKSLAGEWQGKSASGEPVKVIYKVVSNGSVVMEQSEPAQEHEMITMYSLDGDRIIVTHYCSAGNQPTMQTAPSPAANGKYTFTFVRVAGTKTPDEGHMASLSLFMPDKNHLNQTWTFDNHGQSMVENFTLTRVN